MSADQVIDKNLITDRALPYYDSYPTLYYQPKQLGIFPAGANAGQVYSYIEPNPAQGRPDLWWMFYGSGNSYYYMPHHAGDFRLSDLQQQGAQTTLDQLTAESTWYEKVLKQVLPVVAIVVIVGAAVRGSFSRK